MNQLCHPSVPYRLALSIQRDLNSDNLTQLIFDQFISKRLSDKNVFIFQMEVESQSGASKKMPGGRRQEVKRPTEVTIRDFPVLNNGINVYDEPNDYLTYRADSDISLNRFFTCSYNSCAM